jgi:hypothetical protein
MNLPQVYRGDNAIVWVDYGSAGIITALHVRREMELRDALGGLPHATLVRMPGAWRVDVSAAELISGREMAARTMACAVVVESSLGNLAVRVFELYHRPPYPFAVFGREDDAVDWLLPHLRRRA